MPNRDRTGPNGAGAMSGRGRGFCSNKDATTQVTENELGYGQGNGRGFGCGRGIGQSNGCRRAWLNKSQTTNTSQLNKTNKKETLEELKAKRAEIDKAINEIEAKS